MAAVRKQWVKEILRKRDAYEKAIGMPLGEVLGCGHYGCVVASTDPWVVKLTIDPNEPYLWERAINHLDESGYGSMGIVRIKDVVQLNPKVEGKQVFAIVRESVIPVMGKGNNLSDHTRRVEDLGAFTRGGLFGRCPPQNDPERFGCGLRALGDYDYMAKTLFNVVSTRFGHRFVSPWRDQSELPADSEKALTQAIRRMQAWGSNSMQEIAQALECFLAYGFVLRDLHLGNIGWRIHERVPGLDEELPTDRVVIYDLGHTPVAKESERMRTAMVENPGEDWEWYSSGPV